MASMTTKTIRSGKLLVSRSMAMIAMLTALAGATAVHGEDAYIESDGSAGAGINTGFFVGPQTKIEIDFQLTTEDVLQARLFGASGISGNDAKPECECYIGADTAGTKKFSFICGKSGGERQSSNFKAIDLQRHRIVLDFYDAKEFQVWTGDTKVSKALSDFPANRQLSPLSFFCKNYTNTATYSSKITSFAYPTKMKVYGFRIWDAGNLVRDYEPCVKGSRAGFKDKCSNQFVTGENVRAFTAGGDVAEEKDDPYIWSPRNLIGTSGAENNIYLDTGYTFLPTTRLEFDYAMLTNSAVGSPWASATLPYLVTASTSDGNESNKNLAFATSTDGCMNYSIGSSKLKNITCLDTAFTYDMRRTLVVNSNSIAIVTAGYTNFTDSVTDSEAFGVTHTVPRYSLRFGCNYAGDGRYSPMKIYGIKIFESDSLVKDYVPFVTNGVGGLRNSLDATDTIFSKTRINYSGTVSDGTVTNVAYDVGGDISAPARESEAYLEFTGKNGNAINTGYVVTKDTRIDMDYMLWNTKYNGQQFLFEQRDGTTKGGMWARVYYGGSHMLSYSMCDNDNGTFRGKATTVKISNHRQTLTLDSSGSGLCKIVRGGETIYNKTFAQDSYNYARTRTTCVTNLWIGGEWSGNAHTASMRLYSFRISEAGTVVRNYVPCVHDGQAGLYDLVNNTFSTLPGGKVSGATINGDTFQIAPQPARLIHKDGLNSTTLTCLAVGGAQSYQWYVDGVKIDGATSDSYTVNWEKIPAPYVRTYSVKPVYTVFNEKVLGNAVSAVIEMAPRGTVMVLK